MQQQLKRCSAHKVADCQVKMACYCGDDCFRCTIALVHYQGDGLLGRLHHMCQYEYKEAEGIVHNSGKKKLCRVCVDDNICKSVGNGKE